MVGTKPQVFGGKAKSHRYVKGFKGGHETVKPRRRVGTIAVRPAEARTHVLYAGFTHHPYSGIEAMIFEMEPLAKAKRGSVFGEVLHRELGRSVFP